MLTQNMSIYVNMRKQTFSVPIQPHVFHLTQPFLLTKFYIIIIEMNDAKFQCILTADGGQENTQFMHM